MGGLFRGGGEMNIEYEADFDCDGNLIITLFPLSTEKIINPTELIAKAKLISIEHISDDHVCINKKYFLPCMSIIRSLYQSKFSTVEKFKDLAIMLKLGLDYLLFHHNIVDITGNKLNISLFNKHSTKGFFLEILFSLRYFYDYLLESDPEEELNILLCSYYHYSNALSLKSMSKQIQATTVKISKSQEKTEMHYWHNPDIAKKIAGILDAAPNTTAKNILKQFGLNRDSADGRDTCKFIHNYKAKIEFNGYKNQSFNEFHINIFI